MSKMGNLYLEIQEKIDNDKSGKYDSDCNYCVSHYGEPSPPHYPSQQCKSGKHNHCSCDVCF